MQALPPLSLYVHLPWCVKKCPYCDFNSHEQKTDLPENQYLEALLADFELDAPFVAGRPLQSIFFGGGTPSLLSGGFYQALLQQLRGRVEFAPDIEITLEANPGAAEAERFESYRNAGINRVSVGVQSFSDPHLGTLGRIHSSAQAERALRWLRDVGFENFNIDIMHGLPGQSLEQAIQDLETALEFSPKHLSWYQLTIEPNTVFYSKPPQLPEHDALFDIQIEGQKLLQASGFSQYEVSAYSRKNCQSVHNQNYWEFGDYIGIGAGAHSKVTCATTGAITRYRKSRKPADYLMPKPVFRVAEEPVHLEDLPFEFLMNALRLTEGVVDTMYVSRTGQAVSSLEPHLSDLRRAGLIEPNKLALTKQGYPFLNSVLERFVV